MSIIHFLLKSILKIEKQNNVTLNYSLAVGWFDSRNICRAVFGPRNFRRSQLNQGSGRPGETQQDAVLKRLLAPGSPTLMDNPCMMTSSNRFFPRNCCEGIWCFLWSATEQTSFQTSKTPLICDAIALTMVNVIVWDTSVRDQILIIVCLPFLTYWTNPFQIMLTTSELY